MSSSVRRFSGSGDTELFLPSQDVFEGKTAAILYDPVDRREVKEIVLAHRRLNVHIYARLISL